MPDNSGKVDSEHRTWIISDASRSRLPTHSSCGHVPDIGSCHILVLDYFFFFLNQQLITRCSNAVRGRHVYLNKLLKYIKNRVRIMGGEGLGDVLS